MQGTYTGKRRQALRLLNFFSQSLGASAARTANHNVDVGQAAAMDTMPDTEGGASAADVEQGAAADVGAPKSKKGKAKTAGAGQRGVGKRRGKHRFDRRKKSKVSAVPPTHTRSCMPSGVWDAGHATANTACMHTCTWVHCAGDPAPNPRIPRSAAAAGPAHTHRRGVATPPARTTPLHAVDDLVLLVEPCMLGDFTHGVPAFLPAPRQHTRS